ncbi:hypothetical protein HPB47_018442 [Ixodes persulcatus]|uniref:Uncharacterized protein n=1 Tax=Ixodes persulcatus TaxID=34615 RepID=A0AC60QKW2_IXOPE|nr:hypothetical protein HPB47_018442 [Ixodes persulcatus]
MNRSADDLWSVVEAEWELLRALNLVSSLMKGLRRRMVVIADGEAMNTYTNTTNTMAATFLVAKMVRTHFAKKFTFENEADLHNIDKLAETFCAHCQTTVNQRYREFVFEVRNQEQGEKFDDWLTELRTLAVEFYFGHERMLHS